jgi:hypothetical protein
MTPQVFVATVSMTVKDLEEWAVGVYPAVAKTRNFWFFTIFDYGSDPRELYEIPEARELCQRAVEGGLLSALIVTASAAEDEHQRLMGYGALEVWSLAKGYMTGKTFALKNAQVEEFKRDLQASEERLLKKLSERSN